MIKSSAAWIFAAVLLACGINSAAAAPGIEDRPKVVVKPEVTVKGDQIYLGDIATISMREAEYEKLARSLREIKIADAPPPKNKVGIPGNKILDLIKDQGIPIESIGYSIPQIVQVERAGRVIANEEVLSEVQNLLSHDSTLDVHVREVKWDSGQIIPLGETHYEIERLGNPSAGKLPLRVLVKVNDAPSARFVATAIVDDWREVPVLNKTLERGMLISPTDVELVRLNMYKQPADTAESVKDVLGRAVKNRMTAGDTLRKSMIDIPPLVPQGKKINLVYHSGTLHATASGIALDEGLKGESIRVRNEASKAVIKAIITSATEAEVEAQ